MSKLQDIYQRAYNNTPAATGDDNTVGEAVLESRLSTKRVRRVEHYQRISGRIWCISERDADKREDLKADLNMRWN